MLGYSSKLCSICKWDARNPCSKTGFGFTYNVIYPLHTGARLEESVQVGSLYHSQVPWERGYHDCGVGLGDGETGEHCVMSLLQNQVYRATYLGHVRPV